MFAPNLCVPLSWQLRGSSCKCHLCHFPQAWGKISLLLMKLKKTPAICVILSSSGLSSNQTFLRGWDIKTSPILAPNLEAQELQFIWSFTHNLLSTVELTRDQSPKWYNFQGLQGTQPSYHVKAQHLGRRPYA